MASVRLRSLVLALRIGTVDFLWLIITAKHEQIQV